MELIDEVVSNSLKRFRLSKERLTPESYHTVFCEEAAKLGVSFTEYNTIANALNKLNKPLREHALTYPIHTNEELIVFLTGQINRLASTKSNESLLLCAEVLRAVLSLIETLDLGEYSNEARASLGRDLTLTLNLQDELKRYKSLLDGASAIPHESERTLDISARELSNLAFEFKQNLLNIEIDDHEIGAESQQLSSMLDFEKMPVASKLKELFYNFSRSLNERIASIESMKRNMEKLEFEITKLRSQVNEDFVTKVLSRRALMEIIRLSEHAYLENDRNYAIILIEIDNFETLNNDFGFVGTDLIRNVVAQFLKKNLPAEATVGHFMGAIFMVLTAKTPLSETEARTRVQQANFVSQKFVYEKRSFNITHSMGIAFRSNHANSKETLVAADANLRAARELGGNHIKAEVCS
ncbi:hypothetical protein AGMMS50229_08010 [Campylobacterota bacterium]|nr:hypothetical protein AGMMS50229_08010 [Campylobacterota bacterium]